jgi:hypothetical protein
MPSHQATPTERRMTCYATVVGVVIGTAVILLLDANEELQCT